MMKLLNKELQLAAHPTLFIFMIMGVLIIIPSYPFSVVFMFGCLSFVITLMYGRETKDIYFTALLPIKRSDVVKGKLMLLCFTQIGSLLISILVAIVKNALKMEPNPVGLDPNFAYFGFGLIMYSFFNIILCNEFFKTTVKVGKSFILAMVPVVLIMLTMEILPHIPGLEWIDLFDKNSVLKQLPILISGLIIFPLSIYFSFKIGVKRFKKVDL